MIEIRNFRESDWKSVWQILKPVFRAGQTYPYSRKISDSEAHKIWVDLPQSTYVAINEDREIVGTYYLKPNQPSLGAHVCNCGYVVAKEAGGQGIASQMCEHSQQMAIENGFRAMQYNLVISTNETAIHVWEKQGFHVVGVLPEAFKHAKLGYVDALVMYKTLKKNSTTNENE